MWIESFLICTDVLRGISSFWVLSLLIQVYLAPADRTNVNKIKGRGFIADMKDAFALGRNEDETCEACEFYHAPLREPIHSGLPQSLSGKVNSVDYLTTLTPVRGWSALASKWKVSSRSRCVGIWAIWLDVWVRALSCGVFLVCNV